MIEKDFELTGEVGLPACLLRSRTPRDPPAGKFDGSVSFLVALHLPVGCTPVEPMVPSVSLSHAESIGCKNENLAGHFFAFAAMVHEIP